MTPEQKEAFRREVLEEAASVVDAEIAIAKEFGPHHVPVLSGVRNSIRALAASHPAPAADTGQAADDYNQKERDAEIDYRGYSAIDPAPATPNLVDVAQRILDRGYISPSIAEESDDHLALVAALAASQPAPAADTGQAVAWPDEATVDRAYAAALRVLPAHADLGVGEIDKMVRAALVAANHPAPLNAERVREDERDRLFERTLVAYAHSGRDERYRITGIVLSEWGAMLPAERAALRQKEGKA